jgi:TolA-binding protein
MAQACRSTFGLFYIKKTDSFALIGSILFSLILTFSLMSLSTDKGWSEPSPPPSKDLEEIKQQVNSLKQDQNSLKSQLNKIEGEITRANQHLLKNEPTSQWNLLLLGVLAIVSSLIAYELIKLLFGSLRRANMNNPQEIHGSSDRQSSDIFDEAATRITTRFNGLESKVDRLDFNIGEIKNKFQDIETDLSQLKQQNEDQFENPSYRRFEALIFELSKRVSSLEVQNSKLLDKIDTLSTQLEHQQGREKRTEQPKSSPVSFDSWKSHPSHAAKSSPIIEPSAPPDPPLALEQPPTYPNHVNGLVELYNRQGIHSSPSYRSHKVSETDGSFTKHYQDQSAPLLLAYDDNGSFLALKMLDELESIFWLVPDTNLLVNEFNYKAVSQLFDCIGFENSLSKKIKLVKPAWTIQTEDRRFQVKYPGKLEFVD